MMRTAALVSKLSALLATLLVAGPILVLAGCKTKEVTKPDEQTLKDLELCRAAKTEKDKLIAALQDENAKLQVKKASGGEVVVVIEGGNFTIKPGPPGEVVPIDAKVAEAGAKEFTVVVEKSRGSIQKCYEQALKKMSNLQGQTINLTVEASFSPAGVFQGSTSSPQLGEPFDSCIKQVAQKWTMKEGSPSMTFRHRVKLTPL
jgi:hypothetical protein